MNRMPGLLSLLLCLSLSSCTVGRYVFYNFANIDDYKKFQNKPIDHDPQAIRYFAEAKQDSVVLPSIQRKDKKYKWEEGLKKTKTVAFLIMRNDTIIYEHYDNGYEPYTPVNSFSMAKSYVSTLLGMARNEGLIKSLDEPVTSYLPDLPDALQEVTLRHLLNMRSGIDFNESYVSPFSDAAVYYYGRNIEKQFDKLELAYEPDTRFAYRSINTQLLAEVVEAVYNRPLNELMVEKLWQPLGAEQPASWSVDKKNGGTFKAFCCLNAVARDFARLGLLFMNEGNWYGEQLISKEWVEEVTTFEEPMNGFDYKYQWWHHSTARTYTDSLEIPAMHEFFEYTREGETRQAVRWPNGTYSAEGHLGQYVYVNPAESIVIVRLGEKYGKTSPGWRLYFDWLARQNGVHRLMYREKLLAP